MALSKTSRFLKKIRKKNQQIRSSYEGERLVTIFNPRKKEKSVLLHQHVTNWNELVDFSFFPWIKTCN
jgi:hypothetical protein